MTKKPENCLVNFSLLWLLACEIHFWAGVEAKQISHFYTEMIREDRVSTLKSLLGFSNAINLW